MTTTAAAQETHDVVASMPLPPITTTTTSISTPSTPSSTTTPATAAAPVTSSAASTTNTHNNDASSQAESTVVAPSTAAPASPPTGTTTAAGADASQPTKVPMSPWQANAIRFGTPVALVLSLATLITAAALPTFFQKEYMGWKITLGLFESKLCTDDGCKNTDNYTGCNFGSNAGAKACDQFRLMKNVVVSALAFGLLGLLSFGYFFFQKKVTNRLHAFLPVVFSYLFAVLAAVTMVLAINTRSLPFWADGFVPDMDLGYGPSFFLVIIAWVLGLVGTFGVTLFYRAANML
ncbi:hypothetical protein HDU96_000150 [Phlyctochytrium bullatum]|nr:hypothetical protein HDU96_000150 [Phlyctochytrium bullatum]